MAALDLQEQEQLAELKAWWNRYGNLILTAVTLVALVVAAFFAWTNYQRAQGANAFILYDQLSAAAGAKDKAKSQALAGQILEKYPRSTFAPLAAMVNARVQGDAGDLKAAKAQLQWVVDSGKDDDLRQVARLRLAGVLLDEKAFDEGLKLLEAAHPPMFDALYLDRKGDILLAQGKKAEAVKAWEEAYLKTAEKDGIRQMLQLKLELAGGKVPAVAVTKVAS